MIYEWRVYKALPGKMEMLHERFEKYWVRIFEKKGIKVIGFWTAIEGTTNTLYYMVAYDNLAQREKAWNSFFVDPEVIQIKQKLEEEQGQITDTLTISLLQPTSYSPMN